MVIVTRNQFITASKINHILLDEIIESISVGHENYALKKYLLTVVYVPDNVASQSNSDTRECTVAVTSRKEAYLLFKDLTNQIREQSPDALYLNKILENFLNDEEIQTIADSEDEDRYKKEMRATLYDPNAKRVRKTGKRKSKGKRVLRKSKKRR